MTRYAVVGGGISGLSAAYRLRRLVGDDARIALFDPSDALGGTLRTVRLASHPVDVGAEAFVARRPEVPALLAELGLAETQIDTTGVRPLIYAGGSLHPMPDATVNGIPTSAQSLAGLVDDATLTTVADEPSRPLTWERGADPAVAELVGERFGAQVVSRSVDPLLAGVYAGSAATIGLRSAAPGVASALDYGAGSLTEAARAALPPASSGPVFRAVGGGYQRLVDELVCQSGVEHVQAAVTSLDRVEGGWQLGDRYVDAVVLAVPAPQLAALVGGVAPDAAAAALSIPVASSVVLALAVPGGASLPQQSGVLVASGEPLRAKAITLSSRKWGRPDDVELLRLSFGSVRRRRRPHGHRRRADVVGDRRPVGGLRRHGRPRRRARAAVARRDAAVRARPRGVGGPDPRAVAGHAGGGGQLPRRHRRTGLHRVGGRGSSAARQGQRQGTMAR